MTLERLLKEKLPIFLKLTNFSQAFSMFLQSYLEIRISRSFKEVDIELYI